MNRDRLAVLFVGKVATGTVIGTLLGEVVHLSFCFSDERVAACSGATVYVLSSKVQDDAHFHRFPYCTVALAEYYGLWFDSKYTVLYCTSL